MVGAGDELSPPQLPVVVASVTDAAAASSLRMTVAPANEAQRLRQLLCERGELGRSFGEIFDRAQLLGRGRGDGFGLLAGALRGGVGLTERSRDLGCQLGAVSAQLRDLLTGARRFDRRFANAIEILYPRR